MSTRTDDRHTIPLVTGTQSQVSSFLVNGLLIVTVHKRTRVKNEYNMVSDTITTQQFLVYRPFPKTGHIGYYIFTPNQPKVKKEDLEYIIRIGYGFW